MISDYDLLKVMVRTLKNSWDPKNNRMLVVKANGVGVITGHADQSVFVDTIDEPVGNPVLQAMKTRGCGREVRILRDRDTQVSAAGNEAVLARVQHLYLRQGISPLEGPEKILIVQGVDELHQSLNGRDRHRWMMNLTIKADMFPLRDGEWREHCFVGQAIFRNELRGMPLDGILGGVFDGIVVASIVW
jgi:hypothetical protein